MRIKTSLLVFTIIFLTNCKEEKKEDNSELVDLVNIWNNSHNNKDLASLSNLYAENVFYYGTNQEKSKIVEDKKRLLNKYSDFKQVVTDKDLEITKTENGKSISFTKNVTFDSKQKDYPSYLVVSEINGKLKIVTESDLVTDKNISKSSKPTKIKESKMTESEQSENNKLYGDFNGDGKKEYAWVKSPEMLDESYDINWEEGDERSLYCIGGCNSVIYFSDKTIVPITVEGSLGGNLENFGDLNNDNADNIGIWTIPVSWSGGSSSVQIYNCKNGDRDYLKSKGSDYLLIEPIYIRITNHDLTDVDIVKKLNGNRLEIKESEFDENKGWLLKTKIVQLK